MPLFLHTHNGRTTLVRLRTDPRKQKKYPFSSDRQHDRHMKRQYMAPQPNGFEIMQTTRIGGVIRHATLVRIRQTMDAQRAPGASHVV